MIETRPDGRTSNEGMSRESRSRDASFRGSGHIDVLDGLRGVAIIMVLIVHSVPRIGGTGTVVQALNSFTHCGVFGVDLFFVLSGFLITGILLDTKGAPGYFKTFYLRRFLRLFPVYYAFIGLMMLIVPAVHAALHVRVPAYSGPWSWYLLYASNWKANHDADRSLGHFWSLALEEQFYLFWPVSVYLLPRRALGWWCVVLTCTAVVLRWVLVGTGIDIYAITPFRLDALCIGGLVAIAIRNTFWREQLVRHGRVLSRLCFALFAASILYNWRFPWNPLSAFFAAAWFGMLVCQGATGSYGTSYGRLLTRPVLIRYGRYSYCIYVIQQLILDDTWWLSREMRVRTHQFEGLILTAILMVIANWLIYEIARNSWRYFERPILRFKDRLAPKIKASKPELMLSSMASLPGNGHPVTVARQPVSPDSKRRAVWFASILAVGAVYFWIAGLLFPGASFPWDSGLDRFYGVTGAHQTVRGSVAVNGYYDLLGRAFASRELRLPIEPAPELLRTQDPRADPSNAPWRMLDLALYKGHYYLYHGPTPALLMFAPWRLLTGQDLPENFAALLLSIGSYLFLSAILTRVVNVGKFKISVAVYALLLVALGLGQGVPFILHRTKVYEVAIACGLFCGSAGFYFAFVRLTTDRYSVLWTTLSGIFLGLAIGARPHLGLLAVCVFLMLIRAPFPCLANTRRRDVIAFLLPVALCGVAIAAYNFARFDNPFEFGTRYLLGDEGYRHVRPAFRNLGPGLFNILASTPRLEREFPFIRLELHRLVSWETSPFFVPHTEGGYFLEPTAGVFTFCPILILAGFLAARNKWAGRHQLRSFMIIMLLSAVACLLFIAAMPMSSQRYEVDFLPFLLLIACVCALQILDAMTKTTSYIPAICALTALVTYSVFANLALAVQGPYDQFVQLNARGYVQLAQWFSPVEWYRPLLNPPLDVEGYIGFSGNCTRTPEPLVSTGEFGSRYLLSMACSEAGNLRLISQTSVLHYDVRTVDLALPAAGTHKFRIQYTPENNSVTVNWNGVTVLQHPLRFFVTARSQVQFGRDASPGNPNRFDGRITISHINFAGGSADSQAEFRNPLLPTGPDPWVTFRDGFYYYMNTNGRNLTIWKTKDLVHLASAQSKVVWAPPRSGPYSSDIWAPELHFISGKWYIYFAADDGKNENHRIWVVENGSPDPLVGEWTLKGKVADASDKWAVDPTVFENRGQMFIAWSGWPENRDGEQDIYLARLASPWTIAGSRLRISSPQYFWEKRNTADGPGIWVNQAPEVLIHNGDVFLTYSAGVCWADDSQIGLLRASENAQLMDASSWTKVPAPAFGSSAEARAFGVGHNGFFLSPDKSENWIIYHARSEPGQGCGDSRTPRIQPFGWMSDGFPHFGLPVPLQTRVTKPSIH